MTAATTAQTTTSQQIQEPPVAVSSSTTTPPPPAATTSSTTAIAVATPLAATSTSSVSSTPPAVASVPPPTSSTTATTPATSVSSSASAAAQTTSQAITTSTDSSTSSVQTNASSGSTVSKGTAPTTSSSAPLAVLAQPENASTPSPSPTPTPTTLSSGASNAGLNSFAMSIPSSTHSTTSSHTGSAADSQISTASGGISSNGQLTAVPVIGGILGSMGFIALLALIFFFLRRRKAKRGSLLTPLTTGTRTEFYQDEKAADSGRYDEKWSGNIPPERDGFGSAFGGLKSNLIGFGAVVKSKVKRDRSASPTVNLNRGNSQFLDGPIPTHSRNNSVLSGNGDKYTLKERVADWYEQTKEEISWKIRIRRGKEPADPFAAARGMNEKQAQLDNPQPDFSQLLGMDDRELQLETDRRRAIFEKTSSNSSLPSLGTLGLKFQDPFVDPPVQPQNPFADTIAQPQASFAKQNTYLADVRRSRGESMDATNNTLKESRPPSAAFGRPASRYPSSIAPSRDSYRDTVFSSFSGSGNVRKGKGRSDPFDLERPELWQRTNNPNYNSRTSGRPRASTTNNGRGPPLTTSNLQNQPSAYGQPGGVSTADPRVSAAGTYDSKYSSGVSSLAGWGDPGPDLGPVSANSSMRGNASSNGGSQDFGRMAVDSGTVSPLSNYSTTSSKNGVGKAM